MTEDAAAGEDLATLETQHDGGSGSGDLIISGDCSLHPLGYDYFLICALTESAYTFIKIISESVKLIARCMKSIQVASVFLETTRGGALAIQTPEDLSKVKERFFFCRYKTKYDAGQ